MVYFFITAIIFIADLFIKDAVEAKMDFKDEKYILNNKLILRKVHNSGGAGNIGENNQEFVSGFSTALTFGVFFAQAAAVGKKGIRVVKTALSLVLGGALSNVYDRIKRKYVVDYFSFNSQKEKIKNMVFNISDIFIFIGIFILTICAVIGDDKKNKKHKKIKA